MQIVHARVSAAALGAFALVALVALLAAAILASSDPARRAGAAGRWSSLSPAVGDGGPTGQAEADTVPLARRAEQAAHRAAEAASDAELRQVDVDPAGGGVVFRFVGAAGTREIAVTVPSPAPPSSQWEITPAHLSPLTTHARPDIDPSTLRVGPAAAARAVAAHWSGCSPRGLTLVGERDALTWYAFCGFPDGRVVSATVDGRTGAFLPSGAPPARPPPTATPSR